MQNMLQRLETQKLQNNWKFSFLGLKKLPPWLFQSLSHYLAFHSSEFVSVSNHIKLRSSIGWYAAETLSKKIKQFRWTVTSFLCKICSSDQTLP